MMPNLKNDIAPGANYMDRKRCHSIYFYTPSECKSCSKIQECRDQKDMERKKND